MEFTYNQDKSVVHKKNVIRNGYLPPNAFRRVGRTFEKYRKT